MARTKRTTNGGSLTWRTAELIEEIGRPCQAAMNEFNLRVESKAKRKLYPGHGKRSGALQRSIQRIMARWEGNNKVVGGVGTTRLITITKAKRKFNYALLIHIKYGFILDAFKEVRPQFAGILQKHTRKRKAR